MKVASLQGETSEEDGKTEQSDSAGRRNNRKCKSVCNAVIILYLIYDEHGLLNAARARSFTVS